MTALKKEIIKDNSSIAYNLGWTGAPIAHGVCAGVRSDGTMISLPLVNLNASRGRILDYFNNSWALNDVLFSSLACEEAFYKCPYHKLRHPMIFYYGHTASVYVNKLRVAGLIEKPINPEFEKIFEVGVDEMRWDDMHENDQDIWPSVAEVKEYRKVVYNTIRDIIENHPLLNEENLPVTQKSPMWALVMGFEHERIHLETSSVLIRELPIEYVRKPKEWPDFYSIKSDSHYPQNEMIELSKSRVFLGKPEDFPSFGWDNEYGAETLEVRPFAASKFLISNGEFLEFVKDGGYRQEKYWSRDGWQWRRFRNIKWPTFWIQDGPAGSHLYKLRTIFEVIDMQYDWPVCVNFHEAKAYCAWKSEKEGTDTPYRLLTEAEHNAIRSNNILDNIPSMESDMVMSGELLAKGYNLNLESGAESPVNAFAANDKGFYDTFGNVWQWCEDHFHPLAGSKPHPYYDDFSAPCYDGEHQMMLGGSFISTGDEASIWARFHFRPHFYQHSGFRIARNIDDNPASEAKLLFAGGTSSYESREMLDKYLLMHWGSNNDIWGNVPQSTMARPESFNLPLKCAELVNRYATGFDRVLDIGCAVGRSSFELARNFSEVTGIDYSKEFIEAASRLKKNGTISCRRKESGDEFTDMLIYVDNSIDRSKVRFEQGDACNLPLYIRNYDAVLLANTLCRLPEPVSFLERTQGQSALVKKGGVLVMTTPFSWLEEYTPKSNWLAGIAAVQDILSEFELIHQEELPFMIREHSRKFEYVITLASVWKRK
ncbi:MAG: 5-histidylcysteine sulfoxide synthase [Rickettsiales bacterium]